MDCLFCKIAAGEIPAQMVYEDDQVCAFRDIAPQAPVHILIIPKAHVMDSAAQANAENAGIIAHIFVVAARLAGQLGLDGGFRLAVNAGPDAGQTVDHLHVHLLGGGVLGPNA